MPDPTAPPADTDWRDAAVTGSAPQGRLARIASSATWLNVGVVCLVMSVALFVLSRTVADPDLWGHLRFGGDIWRAGAIIQPDVYSYVTGDQPWMNHEWLAEATFYAIFALFGSPGLIAFKTALGLLIAGAVYVHLCGRGLDPGRAGAIVLLVSLMLVQSVGALRPQLFTLVLFLALLFLLRAAEEGRTGWLWALPALFAGWVNLHGGFLLGMAVLLLWFGVHVGSLAWRIGWARGLSSSETRTVAATVAASALATLVNPYGWRLLAFLARPATFVRPEITEWQPLSIMSLYGGMYLVLLAVAAAGIAGSRRERRPALMVLCACIALLPLTAARHGSLFALGTALLAGEHIADAWKRLLPARAAPPAAPAWRLRLWAAAIAFSLATPLLRESVAHFRCIEVDPVVMGFPARAVALLRDSGASGNLAIFFDWGEYALWHLGPRIKVSVDGRRETVYSEPAYARSTNFWMGINDWDALLRNSNTDLALVGKQWPSFNLMKLTPGWGLVYEDPLAALFARDDSPLVEQIRRTRPTVLPHDGRGTCFP